ncbi:tetratricopeptide repeat protein [Limibacterium fermenti]|uniref:tetratricopeptide repeat protein n=1 Tax=Limibacterium fermenti TaxID=3229863 RepID=UPI000E868840|nr:hypothetical protein [Porphyromonadaceae bacterium]
MDDEINITALVEKYEQMRFIGKQMYLDADEFALLADYYHSMDDEEESLLLLDEGLKMHPGSPELMLLRAKTLVFSEQYTEALDYLKYITSAEDEIDLALVKIECLLHLQRNEEVDELINQLLNSELAIDDLYEFITELGFLFNDVDLFDRAISFLQESLKIEDDNADVLTDLAYAYEMKGDFEEAILYNNLLLDANPYSFEAWVNIGKLYSMNEQYDKAIDAFDFALTINDKDVSVRKLKALALYLNENVAESIRLFEECISQAPNDESLYDSLFEAYEVMGEYDRMMKLLDKKEAQFGPAGILIKRAFVYIYQGDTDMAHRLFEEVPEEDHASLDYFMLEGELAFNDNDLVRAEAAYMKAALISEENEDIIDRLANISIAQEKYEQAAGYLDQLLNLSPDYPTAKSRLAFIRFEIGSKEPFNEIIEQFSEDELRTLLQQILGNKHTDFTRFTREDMLSRLNEARENRVLFKNIKY